MLFGACTIHAMATPSQTTETPDVASVTSMSAFDSDGPAKDIFQSVIMGSMAEPVGLDADANVVTCNECTREVDISVAQKIGSSKIGRKTSLLYKCNECNALAQRMNRMFAKRAALAADWSSLSTEQKKDFFSRSRSLQGEELLNGVMAEVTMMKEQRTSLNTGAQGEFHPISVWKNKGLTDEHCASLEAKAPKKWCPLLNDYTYQLMVQSSGHNDQEIIRNITAYKAVDGDNLSLIHI